MNSMSSSSPPSPVPFSHSNPHPHSSPSTIVSRCAELDLSIIPSPGSTPVKSIPLRKSDQSGLKSTPSGKKQNTQLYFAEPVMMQEPDQKLPQRPVGAQAKTRHHHRVPRQSVVPPAEGADHNLEEMRLNSTLALKKELQLLQEAAFNSQKAIKETLQTSERTKTLINARATDVVNVSRSQLLYNSLVNVDIQKDELISQAVQERLLLAPPPCCHSNKEREGPSHLIFMTSDLMRQQPFPPEEGTAKSRLCPQPPSSHSAFELYRRQKCHEALS